MRWVSAFFCAVILMGTGATAQDRPNTILVLDGSGSMWGQIDEVAKITIAQEVVSDLLATLPGEQRLGLTVYGHRARGDCTDIETLVAPAEGTRDAIADAVRGIKPLGKTPMTDSVIAAAEALRYTEDSATVILVSDGVETCNPDPCAAARLLEEAAIDFTAHVIGFDVGSDAEATAQMQCIADETGGMFIPASDAGELAAALTTVVEEPEPIVIPFVFRAVIGDDTRLIDTPVLWEITSDAGLIGEEMQGNPLEIDLLEGSHRATAYSLALEETVEVPFVVIDGGDTVVEALFEEPPLTASLIVPDSVPGGSALPIGWDGPNETRDNIQIYDSAGDRYDFVYTDRGNPAAFIAPFDPGTYEARYAHRDQDVIGTASFTVTETPVGLEAPTEVAVGDTIDVGWTGPNADRDNVQIGPAGERGHTHYRYTKRGNPAVLNAPSEPGLYELRYVFRDQQVIYTQPIEVVDVLASVTAPAQAVAGSTISVDWAGPAYPDDYIGIGAVDATGAGAWENYTYARDGAPLDLLVPVTPGDYVISYFLAEDRRVLASTTITVTEPQVSVTAPEQAEAGSTIVVEWIGPNYDDDYIGIGLVGATGSGMWENFTYTRDGSPADLLVPVEPGDYVIGYFAGQDRKVLTTTPISVTAPEVGVTAPTEAVAGSTISVAWTGPNYDDDYIGIGLAGATGSSQWEDYAYTRDGDPANVLVPMVPGDYTVGYFSGQGREVLASTSIRVSPAEASVIVPAEAVAGSTISVEWTGPDYADDYLGIGLVGATGSSAWDNYTYTRDGSPADLLVPGTPGDYLIGYFAGQDRTAIKSVPITVTPITNAQILAEPSAPAGGSVIVGWDGPAYPGDYIGIGKTGASGSGQWETYAQVSGGNPLTINVPEEPGDYVITYFLDQDRIPIATWPLTVE